MTIMSKEYKHRSRVCVGGRGLGKNRRQGIFYAIKNPWIYGDISPGEYKFPKTGQKIHRKRAIHKPDKILGIHFSVHPETCRSERGAILISVNGSEQTGSQPLSPPPFRTLSESVRQEGTGFGNALAGAGGFGTEAAAAVGWPAVGPFAPARTKSTPSKTLEPSRGFLTRENTIL